MEFRELDQSWRGKNFLFRYTTTHHYRVEIKHDENEITLKLRREEFPEPVIKSFESGLFFQIGWKALGYWQFSRAMK